MPTQIADEEINALVLTSLFGWKWMSKVNQMSGDRLTAPIAPEGDTLGYRPTNWYAPDWTPSDAAAPRFSDWNRCNAKSDKRGYILTTVLPDFCTDRNLLPLLWAKVRERGLEKAFGLEVFNVAVLHRFAIWQDAIAILELTPRQQTEAVLRTLGYWPTEWEAYMGNKEHEHGTK